MNYVDYQQQYQRRYYAANKKTLLESTRLRNAKDPEKRAAGQRRWYQKNRVRLKLKRCGVDPRAGLARGSASP